MILDDLIPRALLDERTFDERIEDALAWITGHERESRARALVALAELAKLAPLSRFCG